MADDPSLLPVAASKVAEEVAPEVGRFMGTVLGSPSFEIGELIAGNFRMRRFKQGLKQMKKAQELLDEAGLQAHEIPMRTLVPLIDKGSSEDDESMAEQWARLLANAASQEVEVPPSFPAVLAELEPIQAELLHHIFQHCMRLAPELRRRAGVTIRSFADVDESFHFHMDNLDRLRLVERHRPLSGNEIDTFFLLTNFGTEFVRACRAPGEGDPPIHVHTKEELDKITAANRERWAEEDHPGATQDEPPATT